MRKLFKVIKLLFLLCFLAAMVPVGAYMAVKVNARHKNFANTENVPYNKVGLVLGTSPKMPSGKPNFYFTSRINAAVTLYKSGKVSYLLVSGDNGSRNYDEPTAMRDALIAAGVPAKAIYLDYAGFRTLDSVVRAREIFGQTSITIISHRFHNERAIYIAEHYDMNAVGFCAKSPALTKRSVMTTLVRESGSRVKMFLDFITGRKPKYLGEKIEIK
jgi:SanA protein